MRRHYLCVSLLLLLMDLTACHSRKQCAVTPFSIIGPPAIVSERQAKLALTPMQRYDAILAKIGWEPDAIVEKKLSRSHQNLVIASFDRDYSRTVIIPNSEFDRVAPNLYLINSDGKYRALTTDDGYYVGIRFSPDEKHIAYMSQGGVSAPDLPFNESPLVSWRLYIHDLQTNRRRLLFQEKPAPLQNSDEAEPSGQGLIGWIPHTHQLLYWSCHPKQLWRLSEDGKQRRLVTADLPTIMSYDPQCKCQRAKWVDAKRHTVTFATIPDASVTRLAQLRTWRALKRQGPYRLPGYPGSTQLLSFSADNRRLPFITACSALRHGAADGEMLAVLELPTHRVRIAGIVKSGEYSGFDLARDNRHLLFERWKQGRCIGRYQIDVDALPAQPLNKVNWHYSKPVPLIPTNLDYAL